MPDCGSQIVLCDLPVRFDTYQGCSHKCSYCFAQRKGPGDVRTHESVNGLLSFIEGRRKGDTTWCDWNIPLHWGGLSDPFQPAEEKYGRSLACLQVMADKQYPVVFSSKGLLMVHPAYLHLMKRGNIVSQVSLVSPRYDAVEPGAPTFTERLGMLERLAANTKRLIIRISPYAVGLADDVCSHLADYRDRGVFGIEIEGMKRAVKRPGMVKVAGDWCYPVETLAREYTQIKREAKRLGLAFYCGENRLRYMSDDTCCCGVVGVPGFIPNRANLNRLVVGEPILYTTAMRQPGSSSPFRVMVQDTLRTGVVDAGTYEDIMNLAAKSKTYRNALGIEAEHPAIQGVN